MQFFEKSRALAVEEKGASSIEYAVLASLIIAVCVVVIVIFGEQVLALFTAFLDAFTGVVG